MKLITVEKVTQDQIDEQVDLRIKLIRECVGQLYPSILWDECWRLRKKQSEQHKVGEI